jgi:hypothetical protein
MHFKNYIEFLSESEIWKEMEFETKGEKEVYDIVEQEMLTTDLVTVQEGDDEYGKLSQMASTSKGEKVLQVVDHELTKFDTPFEFIKWDRLGSDKQPIETCFIVKISDAEKL